MAETLRELVVSLSLQSDNFSRNIQSINKQIKEVESRFEEAGAGIDGFADTIDGLKAKASKLTDTLRLQGQNVEQYQRALNQANEALQKNSQTQQGYTAKLETAKKSQGDLNKEIERAKTVLSSAEKAYGKNSAVANNAREALAALQEQYAAASKEVKDLEGQIEAQNNTLRRNADKVADCETALHKAIAAEAKTKDELDKVNAALKHHKARWEAAAASLDKFGQRAKTAGQNLSRAGQLLTTSITAPLVALGGYAVKASIDAETAFAGVRKTVDMTEEEFARLDDTLTRMSTSKPAAYADIAALAETGGQLGIANENLETFVATMTDLGVATNLVGQEGAAQMAKFANITGMSQGNFDRMGAAIVDLGNNMATTEADIMSMAMRLGAAGAQVGLSEAQILGFSAALSSVGVEAEAGGSAFSKAMIGMQLAVETGKNGLKDYAKVAGMSSAEFQKAWKDDAAGAMQAFIVGLSRMDEEGASTIKVLDDMGFSEVRLRDTLMRATNASGLFANAQRISSGAWKANTALAAEAEKRYGTTSSKLTMLKNRATGLARTFGDDLSPAFGDIIDKAGEWIDSLANMDAGQRQTMMTTAAWLAAIGPGVMLLGKMNTAIGAVSTGFGKFLGASVAAGGGLKGVLSAMGGLLGPAGYVALAGALIAGTAIWYDWASGAKAAREATEGMIATAKKWQETQAKTIFDTGNDPLGRFRAKPEDFTGTGSAKDWISELVREWTDGKGETSETVQSFVDEFQSQTDELRAAVQARQDALEQTGGEKTPESIKKAEDDLKQLDAWDKEIESLLEKRKNKKLSDKDQARLNEIITQRVELRTEYQLAEQGGGYEKIIEGVRAQIARLKAEGLSPGADLFGDALAAAAQGKATAMSEIDRTYEEEYTALAKITDKKERDAALEELEAQHLARKAEAARAYADALSEISPQAMETPDVEKGASDFAKLTELLGKYSKATSIDEKRTLAQDMEGIMSGMDEGQITSFLATMEQVNAQAKELEELNIDPATVFPPELLTTANNAANDFKKIQEYLDKYGNDNELKGVTEAFTKAVPDELARVMGDMQLTTEVAITKYVEGENAEVAAPSKTVEALISIYSEAVNAGVIPPSKAVEAFIDKYSQDPDGVTMDDLKPVVGALVDAFAQSDDADVSLLKPLIPALVDSYNNLTDDADKKALEPLINALVNAYGETEAGIGDKATLLNALTAYIIAYDDTAAQKPELKVKAQVVYNPLIAEHAGSGLDTPRGGLRDLGYADIDGNWNDSDMRHIKNVTGYAGQAKGLYGLWGREAKGYARQNLEELDNNVTVRDMTTTISQYMAALGEGVTPPEDLAARTQAITDMFAALGETDIDLTAYTEIISGFSDLFGEDWTATGLAATLNALIAAGKELEPSTDSDTKNPNRRRRPAPKEHDFLPDATTTATNLGTALNTALDADTTISTAAEDTGKNISKGIATGITAELQKIKDAAIAAAQAALQAAKDELGIASPSRVMRDEVGVMIPRGVTAGIENETKRQQRAVQNAYQALVQPMLSGAQGSVTNNTRTVNLDNRVSVNGSFTVRDQGDLRALALELAALQINDKRALGGVY